MFKFRPHRGSLEEAMREVVELSTSSDLADHIAQHHPHAFESFPTITVNPYGYDERIGWDSHIVTVEGYGVVGFTDAVPPEYEPTVSSGPRP